MIRKLSLFLFFIVLLSGCQTKPAVPAGQPIVVGQFKCNCDPVIAQSIQDAFVMSLFNNTNAKVVKRDTANVDEIFIEGIITIDGDVSSGKSSSAVIATGNGLGGGSSSKVAAGTAVTGVTAQAYKDGELLATQQHYQNTAGGKILAPLYMGTGAANLMVRALIKIGVVGKK